MINRIIAYFGIRDGLWLIAVVAAAIGTANPDLRSLLLALAAATIAILIGIPGWRRKRALLAPLEGRPAWWRFASASYWLWLLLFALLPLWTWSYSRNTVITLLPDERLILETWDGRIAIAQRVPITGDTSMIWQYGRGSYPGWRSIWSYHRAEHWRFLDFRAALSAPFKSEDGRFAQYRLVAIPFWVFLVAVSLVLAFLWWRCDRSRPGGFPVIVAGRDPSSRSPVTL